MNKATRGQSGENGRGARGFEDKIGEPEDVKVRWRYVCYFAFDNLYDFFPRTIDDSGFHAEIPLPGPEAERLARGDLRMALRGRRRSSPSRASVKVDSLRFDRYATHSS